MSLQLCKPLFRCNCCHSLSLFFFRLTGTLLYLSLTSIFLRLKLCKSFILRCFRQSLTLPLLRLARPLLYFATTSRNRHIRDLRYRIGTSRSRFLVPKETESKRCLPYLQVIFGARSCLYYYSPISCFASDWRGCNNIPVVEVGRSTDSTRDRPITVLLPTRNCGDSTWSGSKFLRLNHRSRWSFELRFRSAKAKQLTRRSGWDHWCRRCYFLGSIRGIFFLCFAALFLNRSNALVICSLASFGCGNCECPALLQ